MEGYKNTGLDKIAKSYDKAIDLGRQGIDPYENLPDYIKNNPNYLIYKDMQENETLSDSGRKEIVEFLNPQQDMKCIDLGCCLNLMFRGYKEWESIYYGVDISPKTIELLKQFIEKNCLQIGALHCGSMHNTPFDDSFFDIGTCIGSLEYFRKEFVGQVLCEIYRIMKSKGKFVLDIPNAGSPEFEITALIEEYLGRPDEFDMMVSEFESMLSFGFEISKKEVVGPMIQYFLICKK